MAESATKEQVTLKILVDEKKNKVVYAKAGKDFVDVLLSFLTLPLGTIARLVAKESNIKKVGVGSLSSLYESVSNLEVKHFWTETCKEMLLQPRNSMENYCRDLKLNIDDTENMKYFICASWECSRKESGGLLSTFKNKICRCGVIMNREISPQNGVRISNEGFIPEMATFIISDNLELMPDNFQTSVSLPMILGYENFNQIKFVTVNVTKKEIVDLLKCSLLSKTPLTDLFLRKKELSLNALPSSGLVFDIGEAEANDEGEVMKIKAVLRKSNRKILFALVEEDFVDFLFSFLTFPLGEVERMLKGNSCLGSIDNLFKSVVDFEDFRYLRSRGLKDKLVNSRLAHQFKLQKQILPIDEVSNSNYSCYTKFESNGTGSGYLTFARAYFAQTPRDNGTNFFKPKQEISAPLSYLEPQSPTGDTYSSCGGTGFVKSPLLYVVTDDLVVTPDSSSAISYLIESRISPSDLEERLISIGKKEGLSLLKASLISSSSLTIGLSQFIKPIKEENIHGK